jgi:hypothetical protein
MPKSKKAHRARNGQREWLLTGHIYGDADGPDAPHYLVEAITGAPPLSRSVFVGTDAQREEVDLTILLRLMKLELPGLEPVDPAVIGALEALQRRRT